MKDVFLKPSIRPRIADGHPWIYTNEIESIDKDIDNGSIVYVYFGKNLFCGIGYINRQSQIPIRLLTRKKETINYAFFLNKIQQAWNYRKKIGYQDCVRVVYGEADGLPGLIIDKFHNYFVIQTITLGIEMWKEDIVLCIKEIFHPQGIYERNDVPVRTLEGMQLKKGFLSHPTFDTHIQIQENGLSFWVDIENGQKTGYFLDQRYNRTSIQPFVKGATVTGVFCYTGSFEIHAAHYGAREVIGIDQSKECIQLAKQNAILNKVDHTCSFIEKNGFDYMKELVKNNKKFDVVMLDPPSFTKQRSLIDNAMRGYKEINLRAMQCIHSGGYLITASCTHLVSPSAFKDILKSAAKDAGKEIREIFRGTQDLDHPIVWGIDHTEYLKFTILEVRNKKEHS